MPLSTADRLPPERRSASRNISTPGCATARAGMMYSPRETQARLLSEVPVPRPPSSPPPAMPGCVGPMKSEEPGAGAPPHLFLIF